MHKSNSFEFLSHVGQEVTDQWYSEIKLYRFDGEPRNLSAGNNKQNKQYTLL